MVADSYASAISAITVASERAKAKRCPAQSKAAAFRASTTKHWHQLNPGADLLSDRFSYQMFGQGECNTTPQTDALAIRHAQQAKAIDIMKKLIVACDMPVEALELTNDNARKVIVNQQGAIPYIQYTLFRLLPFMQNQANREAILDAIRVFREAQLSDQSLAEYLNDKIKMLEGEKVKPSAQHQRQLLISMLQRELHMLSNIDFEGRPQIAVMNIMQEATASEMKTLAFLEQTLADKTEQLKGLQGGAASIELRMLEGVTALLASKITLIKLHAFKKEHPGNHEALEALAEIFKALASADKDNMLKSLNQVYWALKHKSESTKNSPLEPLVELLEQERKTLQSYSHKVNYTDVLGIGDYGPCLLSLQRIFLAEQTELDTHDDYATSHLVEKALYNVALTLLVHPETSAQQIKAKLQADMQLAQEKYDAASAFFEQADPNQTTALLELYPEAEVAEPVNTETVFAAKINKPLAACVDTHAINCEELGKTLSSLVIVAPNFVKSKNFTWSALLLMNAYGQLSKIPNFALQLPDQLILEPKDLIERLIRIIKQVFAAERFYRVNLQQKSINKEARAALKIIQQLKTDCEKIVSNHCAFLASEEAHLEDKHDDQKKMQDLKFGLQTLKNKIKNGQDTIKIRQNQVFALDSKHRQALAMLQSELVIPAPSCSTTRLNDEVLQLLPPELDNGWLLHDDNVIAIAQVGLLRDIDQHLFVCQELIRVTKAETQLKISLDINPESTPDTMSSALTQCRKGLLSQFEADNADFEAIGKHAANLALAEEHLKAAAIKTAKFKANFFFKQHKFPFHDFRAMLEISEFRETFLVNVLQHQNPEQQFKVLLCSIAPYFMDRAEGPLNEAEQQYLLHDVKDSQGLTLHEGFTMLCSYIRLTQSRKAKDAAVKPQNDAPYVNGITKVQEILAPKAPVEADAQAAVLIKRRKPLTRQASALTNTKLEREASTQVKANTCIPLSKFKHILARYKTPGYASTGLLTNYLGKILSLFGCDYKSGTMDKLLELDDATHEAPDQKLIAYAQVADLLHERGKDKALELLAGNCQTQAENGTQHVIAALGQTFVAAAAAA